MRIPPPVPTTFVLYSWDGNQSDVPPASGTAIALEPAGDNQGSWETALPGSPTAARGPYLVTATFAGDQYFAPSGATATIKVTAARH